MSLVAMTTYIIQQQCSNQRNPHLLTVTVPYIWLSVTTTSRRESDTGCMYVAEQFIVPNSWRCKIEEFPR